MRIRPVLAIALLATGLGAATLAAQPPVREVESEGRTPTEEGMQSVATRFISRAGGIYVLGPTTQLESQLTECDFSDAIHTRESSFYHLSSIADTTTFLERLRAELKARRAENVVVVAHHLISSGGTHGGFTRGFWFDLDVAIFYRLCTVQDLIEPNYREMVKVISTALEENPPLAIVGGHDHSRQILDGGKQARLVVVSGAASQVTRVTQLEKTLFAHAHLGFIVFDFYQAEGKPHGGLLVNVVETGQGEDPVFALGLDLGREDAPPEQIPATEVPAP